MLPQEDLEGGMLEAVLNDLSVSYSAICSCPGAIGADQEVEPCDLTSMPLLHPSSQSLAISPGSAPAAHLSALSSSLRSQLRPGSRELVCERLVTASVSAAHHDNDVVH